MEQELNLDKNCIPAGGIPAFIMRYLGVTLSGLGAMILLIEGSRNVDSIERFFAFSLIITICAALGFYLALRRSDQANARLLMGVFLGCIPIFWTQLGAVIYSWIYGVSHHVPSVFRMPQASGITITAGLAIAAGLIVPLSGILARIFVPRVAIPYSLALLVSGVLLALPLRQGGLAELILVVVGFAVLLADRHYFSSREHLQTEEMSFARIVLLSVPMILATRACFYHGTPTVMAALSLATAGLSFWTYNFFTGRDDTTGMFISDLFIALALSLIVKGNSILSYEATFTLAYAVPALFLFIRGNFRGDGFIWMATSLWVMLAGSCMGRELDGLIAQIATVLFPVLGVVECYRRRSALNLLLSFLVLAVNIYVSVIDMLRMVVEYRWSVMMVSGIALIFLASYIEWGIKALKHHWNKQGA